MALFIFSLVCLLSLINSAVLQGSDSSNMLPFILKLQTEYVNETTLRNLVFVSDEGFIKFRELIPDAIKLSLSYKDGGIHEVETLQVINSSWSFQNGNVLIIYSNNPLNLSDQWTQNQLSLFPTSETLLTTLQSQQITIQLQISQSFTQQIFPQLRIVGDTILQFNITDASFPASYLKQSSMQQWYLIFPGYIIVLFLVVNYFVRSFYTDRNINSDHGEIILHYLTLASPTLIVHSLTAELMSFCYGFMLLNFPWMNDILGQVFGNSLDTTPFQMKAFFTDLGFGSTYCLGFAIIIVLSVVGYAFLSLDSTNQLDQQKNRTIFFNFMYNVFLYGALFSAMLSIQGIIINSVSHVLSFKNAVSSIFYLISIILLILIVIDAVHSLFKYQSRHFYKIRGIIKTMFLSLSHLRVNYFVVVMICLDLIFGGAEYLISRKENSKAFNKLWIFKNILLNLALLFLLFLPIKLIAVILGYVFVSICVGAEIYEHFMINQANKLAQNNQVYHPARHNTTNHTIHTDRDSKRLQSNLANVSFQFMQESNSHLQVLPNTVTAIKSNRSKKETQRKYEQTQETNINPLQQTIEYEPRHRRERRKNSLKNPSLVSMPNHKVAINSSNEHILHVKKHRERSDFFED